MDTTNTPYITPPGLTRQETTASLHRSNQSSGSTSPTPLMRYDTVAAPTPLMRYDTVAAPTPLMRYDTVAAPTPLTRQTTTGFMTPPHLTRQTTMGFMTPPHLVHQTTTGFANPTLLRRTYDEPSSSPPYHDAFYQPLEDQILELRKQINEMSDKLDNVISNMRN